LFKTIQLFRPINLAIVALTQWLVAEFVVFKTFRAHQIFWEIQPVFLLKIIAATVLTTASGYVINDIFDEKTDQINRPEKAIVGKIITRKSAIVLYSTLIISVLGLNFWILRDSQAIARPFNSWVFGAVAVALFLYAWRLKATPILGNLLVAILCAIVPLVVYFQEKRAFEVLKMNAPNAFFLMENIVFGYAFFAGMTTFLREIVKDLEDVSGDSAAKLNTTAVSFGEKTTRQIVLFLTVLFGLFLIKTAFFFVEIRAAKPAFWLLFTATIGLVFFIFLKINAARNSTHYRRISLIIKVLMLVGLVGILGY
jgi:4-hydroxybenzoate polyprenyltransferase